MHTPIDILEGAEADLKALQVADPEAFAAVYAFLEEAETAPDLIAKFTSDGNYQIGRSRANVKRWRDAQKLARNLFRIRILDTPATCYRVVYGYDWHQRRVEILAVLRKDEFDYAVNDEIADRIFADWDRATAGRAT